ncbi:uncharacterized protein LOC123291738 [Chrysoperla carnea]|uniref:uncharacterized protein LOC123291738 n=1 Tax=Chrysoperla carnea TaxID=189513 RepID=UPI001D073274|nr:uncharacterized protein LOC123291738 [Chrysoperla carnea]
MSTNKRLFNKIIVIIVLQSFWILEAQLKTIPEYIPSCKRHDPRINECVKNATIVIRPYLKKGIPELGIPAIEPLHIPMVKLEQGTDAVNYKARLSNIVIDGLSTYQFREVNADIENHIIEGKIDVGNLRLRSDYVIMGRALLLPIRGNGVLSANFSSAHADIKMHGSVIKRKGKEYYHNTETDVKIQIGRVKAMFDNLFDGDEMLTKVTNEFLNMHAKEIVEEVKPAVETVIAMIVDDITNKVFQSLPYNRIFPE